MAEERTLGLARAYDRDDEESKKSSRRVWTKQEILFLKP